MDNIEVAANRSSNIDWEKGLILRCPESHSQSICESFPRTPAVAELGPARSEGEMLFVELVSCLAEPVVNRVAGRILLGRNNLPLYTTGRFGSCFERSAL